MLYTKIIAKGTVFERKIYYKDKSRTIIHREGGPAYIWKDGHKEWYINGKLHREDGPAIIYSSGHKEYYLDDEWIEPGRYWRKIKKKRFGGFV